MKSTNIIKTTLICFIILVSCSQKPKYDLAISDVQVFDTKTNSITPNQTVYIKGDSIALITNSDTSFSSETIIEGKQRLLTPGFIDTHVHLVGNYGVDAAPPEDYVDDNGLEMLRGLTVYDYLNHGVTTIIDMAQPEYWMDVTLGWQNDRQPNFPNLYINGGSMVTDETYARPAHHIEVMNPDDGRQKVRDYAAKGLKYMKFYSKLRKPDYEAMADEAKKHGIVINTHVDNNIMTISEAMDVGVLNFEHFFTLTPSILNYDTHWPLMNEAYGIKMNSSIDEFSAHMSYFFSYIKANPEFDTKLTKLFDRMAKEEATLSTAINVLASTAGQSDVFTSFEYYPIRTIPMVSYSSKQQKQLEESFKTMMTYVKQAHDQGVKLRIGTDCRNGGPALLSELLLMVEHGFEMGEVLQIATINGYESMKLDTDFGSIEVGKNADLILFDKNPFENPKYLLSDKTIIKDGKIHEKKHSIALEFQHIILTEGIDKAKQWLENDNNKKKLPPLDAAEFRHIVKQLINGHKIEEGMEAFNLFKANFPEKSIAFNSGQLTNLSYVIVRDKNLELLKKFKTFSDTNFPDEPQYVGLNMYLIIEDQGIEAAKTKFDLIKSDDHYILNEGELNGLGYLYIQNNQLEKAITIFEMNVSAFSDSWNAYDSLGEANVLIGNTVIAKANYLKSIKLNPDSVSGKKALEQL